MKVFCALVIVALPLMGHAFAAPPAGVYENRWDDHYEMHINVITNIGSNEVMISFMATLWDGGTIPTYDVGVNVDSPKSVRIKSRGGLLIDDWHFSTSDKLPPWTNGLFHDVAIFPLTSVQFRDIVLSDSLSVKIVGDDRTIDCKIATGPPLRRFFVYATNTAHRVARGELKIGAQNKTGIKSPIARIGGATWKVTEQNETWWRCSYQVTVRNDGDLGTQRRIVIKFLDAQGFTVDSKTEYSVGIPAGESKTVTGYKLVNSGPAATIKSVRAEWDD